MDTGSARILRDRRLYRLPVVEEATISDDGVKLPYEIHVDEDARTIVVRGTGTGTTADTLELIRNQLETFRAYPGYSLLYDATALEIDSSPADMMRVAAALFESRGGAGLERIAVAVPAVREQLARVFAALADPHGVTTNVFTNVEDARAWLARSRGAQDGRGGS